MTGTGHKWVVCQCDSIHITSCLEHALEPIVPDCTGPSPGLGPCPGYD